MKHDCEVYMGLYLTFGILIGSSGIMTALLYWQIMRMRYLMSPPCQQAWGRFDVNASALFAKSWCPGLVARGYAMVRKFFKSQIDSTVSQAQGGAQPSGISGML